MSNTVNKTLKQIFPLVINTSGQSAKLICDIDKSADVIIGLEISSTRDDLIYYRGSQQIKINGIEFFPEGFESKKLMCGLNVVPHLRYYRLGNLAVGNRKVEIIYTDTDNPSIAPFEPYTVFLYVYSSIQTQ
jgi:hypothetical protein